MWSVIIFSEYSILDHEKPWPIDLWNLISLIFYVWIKKRSTFINKCSYSLHYFIYDPQSSDIMVLILVNPEITWFRSEKNHDPENQDRNFLWSRTFDPSHTHDHRMYYSKLIVSRELFLFFQTALCDIE